MYEIGQSATGETSGCIALYNASSSHPVHAAFISCAYACVIVQKLGKRDLQASPHLYVRMPYDYDLWVGSLETAGAITGSLTSYSQRASFV